VLTRQAELVAGNPSSNSSAAAKRAHYAWADIPRALVKQWRAEYRRRQKAIRKLEADAAKQEPPAAKGVATGD